MDEAVGLTGLQLSILGVLWDREEATTQEVRDAVAEERELAPTTVATILSRLEKKGVVTHRRDGRQFVYRAVLSRAQVRRSKVRDLTESLFGGDPAALLTHLVRADEVDPDELARIRELIDRAEAAGEVDGEADG